MDEDLNIVTTGIQICYEVYAPHLPQSNQLSKHTTFVRTPHAFLLDAYQISSISFTMFGMTRNNLYSTYWRLIFLINESHEIIQDLDSCFDPH